MAHKDIFVAMIIERHIAMRTFRNFTAFRALDRRRIRPARTENQNLPRLGQRLIDSFYQLVGKTSRHTALMAFIHRADNLDFRLSRTEIALRQLNIARTSRTAVVNRLKRRRCRAHNHIRTVNTRKHHCCIPAVIARCRCILLI